MSEWLRDKTKRNKANHKEATTCPHDDEKCSKRNKKEKNSASFLPFLNFLSSFFGQRIGSIPWSFIISFSLFYFFSFQMNGNEFICVVEHGAYIIAVSIYIYTYIQMLCMTVGWLYDEMIEIKTPFELTHSICGFIDNDNFIDIFLLKKKQNV